MKMMAIMIAGIVKTAVVIMKIVMIRIKQCN